MSAISSLGTVSMSLNKKCIAHRELPAGGEYSRDYLVGVKAAHNNKCSEEKHNFNFGARMFATHPLTEDRVRHAQEEISTPLPAKSKYLVNTSAFQEAKSRLADRMHDRAPSVGGRPALHRRTRPNEDSADHKGPILRRPNPQ